jgi:hypothetical protein
MITLTGRTIPKPPPIRLDSNRKALNDLKKVEQWLLDNAREEATLKKDDYFLTLIRNEVAGKLPPATVDSLNLYLFGEIDPQII